MKAAQAPPHSASSPWWNERRKHSQRLLAVTLFTAVACALAHYTFGEWITYPAVKLWKEGAYWADYARVVPVPVLLWGFWSLVSLRRLKPAPLILSGTIILIVGD